eukprot:32013_1
MAQAADEDEEEIEPPSINTLLSNCDNSAVKLLKFMTNNIVNDSSNIKYHNIKVDKLSNKLTDPEIVIDVLILSGFEMCNSNRLKFNISHFDKLQKLHRAIKSIHNSNSIKKSYTDSNKIRQSRNRRINIPVIYCVCKNVLRKTTPNQVYGNDSQILCDHCLDEIDKTEIMFHCDKGTLMPQHIYGYELCQVCAMKQIQGIGYNDNIPYQDQNDDASDNDEYSFAKAMKKFNNHNVQSNILQINQHSKNGKFNDGSKKHCKTSHRIKETFLKLEHVLLCYLKFALM